MSLSLHKPPDHSPDRPPDHPGKPPASGTDPIDAWLSVVQGALRLPASRAGEVLDELEDHLRARVHDQLLAGEDETTAIQRAVEELGEATALARRLQHAQRTPIRRHIMHASIFTVSAAALGLSIASFTGVGASSPPAVYPGAAYDAPSLPEDARMSVEPEWTLHEFASAYAQAAGKPSFVHWRTLEDYGIDEGWTLDITLEDTSPESALRLLNQNLEDFMRVAAHEIDGRIEFATQDYFDRNTMRLARYDVGPIVAEVQDWANGRDASRSQIMDLIRSCVEPDSWEDSGGDLASMHAVGNLLFIQAPERYFQKIEWVLAQFDLDNDQHGPQARPRVEPLRDANTTRVADRQPPVRHVVYIYGDIVREGVYQYVEGVTLARLLVSAGARQDSTSAVEVVRNGVPSELTSLSDVLAGVAPDTPLAPADLIRVLTPGS